MIFLLRLRTVSVVHFKLFQTFVFQGHSHTTLKTKLLLHTLYFTQFNLSSRVQRKIYLYFFYTQMLYISSHLRSLSLEQQNHTSNLKNHEPILNLWLSLVVNFQHHWMQTVQQQTLWSSNTAVLFIIQTLRSDCKIYVSEQFNTLHCWHGWIWYYTTNHVLYCTDHSSLLLWPSTEQKGNTIL